MVLFEVLDNGSVQGLRIICEFFILSAGLTHPTPLFVVVYFLAMFPVPGIRRPIPLLRWMCFPTFENLVVTVYRVLIMFW